MPEKEIVNIPYFGNVPVTKAVISLQNDIGTKYGVYIAVQNELIAARSKLREDLAKRAIRSVLMKNLVRIEKAPLMSSIRCLSQRLNQKG